MSATPLHLDSIAWSFCSSLVTRILLIAPHEEGFHAALETVRDPDGRMVPSDTVIEEAVREYLTPRGYLPPTQPQRITPAPTGSGSSNISVDHDRYFAEA